jgi:hypothetical protein
MRDANPAGVAPVAAWPASAERAAEALALEPLDELPVLTACDNFTDMLLPDQGPARRLAVSCSISRGSPKPAVMIAI